MKTHGPSLVPDGKGVQIFPEHSLVLFCADGFAAHRVVDEQTDLGLDAFS